MKLSKFVSTFCLLLVSLLIVSQPLTVLAQGTDSPRDKIELTAIHTKLEGTSQDTFKFEVKVTYNGNEARTFDLSVTGPKDWGVYTTPSYPTDKKIKDVRLEPYLSQTMIVYATPPYWLEPEPGNYEVTLEISSTDLKETITLTAVITATYALSLSPSEERYNTSATSGKDNFFSIEIQNTGSDTINNITFSSSKPKGWSITLSPDKVESLEAGKSQSLEVNIKPGAKTIAGDYMITLSATGKEATADDLSIRVTVETPTIWGWTGVVIILIVIGGLSFVIMRFSRR